MNTPSRIEGCLTNESATTATQADDGDGLTTGMVAFGPAGQGKDCIIAFDVGSVDSCSIGDSCRVIRVGTAGNVKDDRMLSSTNSETRKLTVCT